MDLHAKLEFPERLRRIHQWDLEWVDLDPGRVSDMSNAENPDAEGGPDPLLGPFDLVELFGGHLRSDRDPRRETGRLGLVPDPEPPLPGEEADVELGEAGRPPNRP
jgi:hypothetical protein